jgi:hypothetical protein
MTMHTFIPGQISDLPLTGRSLAAVDLGFGISKTCGIAVAGINFTPKAVLKSFGGCVSHICSDRVQAFKTAVLRRRRCRQVVVRDQGW